MHVISIKYSIPRKAQMELNIVWQHNVRTLQIKMFRALAQFSSDSCIVWSNTRQFSSSSALSGCPAANCVYDPKGLAVEFEHQKKLPSSWISLADNQYFLPLTRKPPYGPAKIIAVSCLQIQTINMLISNRTRRFKRIWSEYQNCNFNKEMVNVYFRKNI